MKNTPSDADLLPHEVVIRDLALKFVQPNGRIAWKEAVQQDPTLAKFLRFTRHDKAMAKASQTVANLRKKGHLPAVPVEHSQKNGHTPKLKSKATATKPAAAPGNPIDALLEHSRFCARCGNDLRLQLRSAALQSGMAGQ